MTRPRAFGAAAAAVASLLALGARAADLPPLPEVRVHVAADVLTADVLADGVRARLAPLGVSVTWDEVAAVDAAGLLESSATTRTSALAEVWLDARAAHEAVVLIVPREGEGVLARRLVLPAGLDDVTQAEIVYIVESAVRALLAAAPFGVSRAAARAALEGGAADAPLQSPATPVVVAAAPVAAPAAPAPRLAVRIGAAAGAQAWSASQPVLPAAAVFVALERASAWGRLGVAVSGGLRGDAQTTTPDASVSVGGGDLHLWFTMAKALAGGALWHLSFGPGLFIDSVAVIPAAVPPRTVTVDTSTHLDVTLGVSLRRDLVQLGPAVVFVSAAADVLPWPGRYTAQVDGATTTLLQPWPVRPSLALGVAFGPN